MAPVGMPRGNATAWVSKPRHRSPPIRPGENNPGPDHGSKILRPGSMSRARHTSPPGTGGEANLNNGRHPVPPASVSTFRPGSQPSKRSKAARPNRISRSGKAPRTQIQPSEKIKKTPCFNLILLTPKHDPEADPEARRQISCQERGSYLRSSSLHTVKSCCTSLA